MARGLALVVGLRSVDPAAYAGWDGRDGCWGCELDAENIGQVLSSQGFQVHTIKTRGATASNILRGLASAAESLVSGDIFAFYFSGHGGDQHDLDGDEQDGRDETLVAYDRELVDDELDKIWPRFRPGVRIVMISDSCNAGTNYRMRGRFDNPTPIIAVPDREAARTMQAQLIHMGGCRDGFSSVGYETGGAFTIALCSIWAGGGFQGTYQDFYQQIVAAVSTRQQPQYNEYGPVADAFRQQRPFTIGATRTVDVSCELSLPEMELDRARQILAAEAGPCLIDAFGAAMRQRSGEASASCTASSGGEWSCTGSVTIRF